MANGWESRNVEEQQSAQQAEQPHATPASKMFVADQNHAAMRADAEHKRKIQALELQRERILSERTSSPLRRSALTNALADIEEKLAELGWTIHL